MPNKKSFWKFIRRARKNDFQLMTGLEIGCGKGRNAIWLAHQGVKMKAFDFSPSAIRMAKSRVSRKIIHKISFSKHDITETWPFAADSFDFVIDNFVSTDIEGVRNRRFLAKELYRVLKPGGYFFLYTNTTKSDLYREMVKARHLVSNEKHAFYYPEMKKFEKVFDKIELDDLYRCFELREAKTYTRLSLVSGRPVTWEHFWRIYRKPKYI